MTTKQRKFDIFVGAETGLLKGVKVKTGQWENVTNVEKITREKEITALCWRSHSQDEACIGHRDGSVEVYNRSKNDITDSYTDVAGDGILRGLLSSDSNFISCTDKGQLRVTQGNQEKLSLDVGGNISCLRQHHTQSHVVATGGKENDLKIWDLNKPEEPIFKAKNVKHDWLNLQVPVWVADAAFIPDSDKIVTSTGHHQVRVYDPSSSMRRPVLDIEFDEYPLTALGFRHGYNQVIVGNTHGVMALVDLRGKGYVVQKYKGFAGGIRSIACHQGTGTVVSCGLDRYLRVHDIEGKELVDKFYMKSRLNQVLLVDIWDTETEPTTDKISQLEEVEMEPGKSDDEEIWDKLGTVKIKQKTSHKNSQKRKKEEEDSDDSDFVDEEKSEEEEVDDDREEDEEESAEASEEEPTPKRTKKSKPSKDKVKVKGSKKKKQKLRRK